VLAVPSRDPVERQQIAAIAGLTGWANTEDPKARMAHVRKNSPINLEYHARKMGIDLDNCTDDERKRAERARTLWYKRLHLKTRAGRKAAQARRLSEEADRLQAVAEALDTLDGEANA
jgi:hypothetical protein